MSEQEPTGIYVYQPFGTVTHPDRAKTGRLFALGGFPAGIKCEGFTREEAEAVADAINEITWMMERCHACGHHLRFASSDCPRCGAAAQAPWAMAQPGKENE